MAQEVLVTGTLALAHPQTRNALRRAVRVAREGNSKYRILLAVHDTFIKISSVTKNLRPEMGA
eukprot:scaffold105522_cov18-Tisochrysis_lutea.AAC.1